MEPKTINVYGDKDINKMALFGHDISSQRLDDLDRMALTCLLSENKKTFLDIGCGEARVGFAASMIADKAILVDVVDISEKVERFRSATNANIEFFNMDARSMTRGHVEKVDIAYSQRFIHYLRFGEAQSLLALIHGYSCSGSYLFVSASGIESELGIGYEGVHFPVENRYFPLTSLMSEKHNIHGSVCLYSEDDLRRLAVSSGYKEEKIYSSGFGNVKGMFRK